MRIKPGLPPEEVNQGSGNPLIEVSHLLFVGALVLVALALVIGFAVDEMAEWVSPETEREMFAPLVSMLLTEVGVTDPDATPEGLQGLVDRAAKEAPPFGLPLKAHLSCSLVPNALAMPGGHIVVTAGLLKLLEHENSLVFVLGHEIGHVVHRDPLKGMGRGVIMGLMLESLFAFGGGSADVAGEATQIALRSYSREQELLADEVGAGVVSRIYGHVGGVHEAHDLLADATDERWLDRLNWSRTHPVGPERQKRVSELASNRQWKLEGALTPLDPGLAAACEIQQEQGEP